MMHRLRQEDGFTLPEMLITLIIGLTLSLATFSLIEVTMRRSGEISARVEAVQSGRLAMDTVTRELRSQVCIPRTAGPAVLPVSVEAANPDSITFFADLRDTSNPPKNATPTPPPVGTVAGPDRRTLSFVSDGTATGFKLIESVYKPIGGSASTVYTYPAKPTSVREVLANVQRAQVLANGVLTDVPFFQYFKYDFKASAAAGEIAAPKYSAGTGVLTATDLKAVAKIKITYKANPAKKRADGRAATVFTNEVFTRNVDPNADTDELSVPCN